MNTNQTETGEGNAPRDILEQNQLKDAFVRRYTDSGQATAYIIHASGVRTEGDIMNKHITALLQRAMREGLPIRQETW
jgi:hypothetical protein